VAEWAELATNLPSGSSGAAGDEDRPPLPPGSRVARYELVGLLGQGGMGQVYRARELLATPLGGSGRQQVREVALKLLRSGDRRDALRLLREGTITAALRDPGIVQIHDQGEHEGRPFLIYELIEGARSLRDAAAGLDLRGRLRLVRDAARALGHAHAHGVVHRDVKPENLLVDLEGRVRVTDFGLAMGESLDVLTRTGELVGTPRFLAPEQAAGHRDLVGPATDVWALGILIYLLITGRHAFPQETLAALCTAIAAGARPRLRPGEDCDERLVAIVDRALEVRPERRHPDGAALAADLDGWLAASPSWWTLRRRVAALGSAGLAAAAVVAGLTTRPCPPEAPAQLRQLPWSVTAPVQPSAPRTEVPAVPARSVGKPALTRLRVLDAVAPVRCALAFEDDRRLVYYPVDGPPLRWDARDGRLLEPPPRSRIGTVATVVPLTRGLAISATPEALICAGEDAPPPAEGTMWLAASHDRSRVVAWPGSGVSDHPEVRIYGAASGRLLRRVGLDRPARAAALSADGQLVAIAGGGTIEVSVVTASLDPFLLVCEVERDKELLRVPLAFSARAVAFSTDGARLAIGTNTGQLLIWRPGTQTLETLLPQDPPRERRKLLAPTAHEGSSRWLGTGTDDRLWSLGIGNAAVPNDRNELRVWDGGAGLCLLPPLVWAAGEATVALSPDGALVAISKWNGQVEVWSTR
jgi:hypothetical protein